MTRLIERTLRNRLSWKNSYALAIYKFTKSRKIQRSHSKGSLTMCKHGRNESEPRNIIHTLTALCPDAPSHRCHFETFLSPLQGKPRRQWSIDLYYAFPLQLILVSFYNILNVSQIPKDISSVFVINYNITIF